MIMNPDVEEQNDSGSEGIPDSGMTDYESIFPNSRSSCYDHYPYGAGQVFSTTPYFAQPPLPQSMYYASFYPPPPKPPANNPATSTGYEVECTSWNKTRVTSVQGPNLVYNYNVKMINRSRKSVFYIKPLLYKQRFSTLNELKKCIIEEIGPIEDDVVGYIEPGHGQRGKIRDLSDDDDLSEMYVLFKRQNNNVLLWCYDGNVGEPSNVQTRKRTAQTTSDSAPSSKRQAIAKSISEVEDIIKTLKEKHGDDFSVEKLNCWAHMLNIGKHSSYDEPPDLPFFRGLKEKAKHAGPSITVQPHTSSSGSPTKRVGLRAQCIDQLSKWHALLVAGGIDQAQYGELKDTILGDIKGCKT